MYYTHLAFGLLISLLAFNFLNIENKILFVIIVLFFSLFPDIDETNSKIGRRSKLLSWPINFFLGHRGLIHSIHIPVLLYIIFKIFNQDIAYAAVIGYLSHLIGDSITKAGIKPLYPLNIKISGFLKTGSLLEKVMFLGIMVLNAYLIIY